LEWLNRTLSLKDISQLYAEKAGQWLLFEVLEKDGTDNPIKLKLLTYSSKKDDLHDFLMDEADWNWHKSYLFVLADPTKPCTIPGT